MNENVTVRRVEIGENASNLIQTAISAAAWVAIVYFLFGKH